MAIKSINKRINFNTPLNLESSTHLEKSDTLAQFLFYPSPKCFNVCNKENYNVEKSTSLTKHLELSN